jgi:phage N-6-adenine-methyltransferase
VPKSADSASFAPAFTETASAVTGKSRRTIEDTIQLAMAIAPEAREILRETEAADNKTDLRALARYEEDSEVQIAAATLVSTGEAPSVRLALLSLKQDPALGPRITAAADAEGAPLSHQEDYDSDEWFTPADYIEAAREVMTQIDLDPASCAAAQETVRAVTYYTKADDGLKQEWRGRIWLNPPYSQPAAAQFGAKLLAEVEAGRVTEAVMVQNASTDTSWFHALARRSTICLTRGRINFNREDGGSSANRYGQVFFYFGKHERRFEKVFGAFGLVGKLRTTLEEGGEVGG